MAIPIRPSLGAIGDRGPARNTLRDEPDSIDSGLTLETDESRLDRISRRALELYQRRRGAGGREAQDWLDAEREIDATDDR